MLFPVLLPSTPYSEVRRRIETSLADALGSDRSRDREGAEALKRDGISEMTH
jgi:hypothetical protein